MTPTFSTPFLVSRYRPLKFCPALSIAGSIISPAEISITETARISGSVVLRIAQDRPKLLEEVSCIFRSCAAPWAKLRYCQGPIRIGRVPSPCNRMFSRGSFVDVNSFMKLRLQIAFGSVELLLKDEPSVTIHKDKLPTRDPHTQNTLRKMRVKSVNWIALLDISSPFVCQLPRNIGKGGRMVKWKAWVKQLPALLHIWMYSCDASRTRQTSRSVCRSGGVACGQLPRCSRPP